MNRIMHNGKYTTYEAAEILDLSYQGLMSHISRGTLVSTYATISGRLKVRLIEPCELKRFKKWRENGGKRGETAKE